MPKNGVEQRLARRLAIIDVLPTDAEGVRGLTVVQVMQRLRARFPAERRTFERDLSDLGAGVDGDGRLGLRAIARQSAEDRRVTEWFASAASKMPVFQSVTAADALIAAFASTELAPFLPREARAALDSQVAQVERKLGHLKLTGRHSQGMAFRDKIRRVPDGVPLLPSKVEPAHLQAVVDALMEDRMLRLVYRAAMASAAKSHDIYPIGLVIHDRSLRLLAIAKAEFERPSASMEIKHFLLHRIQELAITGPAPARTKIPTLDEAIASGALDMWNEGKIALHLRFADGDDAAVFARTLEETPLALDQLLFSNGAGQRELTATVSNTSSLRRMLRSMAREVRILAPDALKNDMRQFLVDSLTFHQGE